MVIVFRWVQLRVIRSGSARSDLFDAFLAESGSTSLEKLWSRCRCCVLLEKVSRHFGDFVAVNDVDLRVEQGEFVTLLGPSGCGKTTTLRMVAGLEQNTGGRISIGNEIVSDAARGPIRAAGAPPARHGVPVLRDLAAYDGVRERRLSAAHAPRARPPKSATA